MEHDGKSADYVRTSSVGTSYAGAYIYCTPNLELVLSLQYETRVNSYWNIIDAFQGIQPKQLERRSTETLP